MCACAVGEGARAGDGRAVVTAGDRGGEILVTRVRAVVRAYDREIRGPGCVVRSGDRTEEMRGLG